MLKGVRNRWRKRGGGGSEMRFGFRSRASGSIYNPQDLHFSSQKKYGMAATISRNSLCIKAVDAVT